MGLILRVVLNGFLLAMVFPKLFTDIHFHGQIWPEGIVAGLIFAIVVYVVECLLSVFSVLTLGVVWILRCLLWFLIPALQLWVMATWFPQFLTIGSIGSGILAGFVLMIVNGLTGSTPTGAKTAD